MKLKNLLLPLLFFGANIWASNEVVVYVDNPAPWRGSVGHAAIRVDEHYLSFCPDGPHTLEQDHVNTSSNIFRFDATKLNVTKMIAKIEELKKQTSQYALFCKNCTSTVAQVLTAGGFHVGDIYNWGAVDAPTPWKFRNDLFQQFSEKRGIVAASAFGRTERNWLNRIAQNTSFFVIEEGRHPHPAVLSTVKGQGLYEADMY